MFIVYEGNNEVLVTSTSAETEFLKEWFKDAGRNPDDYDRSLKNERGVCITSTCRVD